MPQLEWVDSLVHTRRPCDANHTGLLAAECKGTRASYIKLPENSNLASGYASWNWQHPYTLLCQCCCLKEPTNCCLEGPPNYLHQGLWQPHIYISTKFLATFICWYFAYLLAVWTKYAQNTNVMWDDYQQGYKKTTERLLMISTRTSWKTHKNCAWDIAGFSLT